MLPIGTHIDCPACGTKTALPYLCRPCWTRVGFDEQVRFYKTAERGGGYTAIARDRLAKIAQRSAA